MSGRQAAIGALALAAAGCLGSLRVAAPEVHTYRLAYDPPALEDARPLGVVLHVTALRVDALYARDAIVYRSGPYRIGSYYYHRWFTDPGRMITDLLARDLAATGAYEAVEQGPSLVPSDYEITGTLDALEERTMDGRCAGHVRLRLLVYRRRGRGSPVLLKREYAQEAPCKRPGEVPALVEALSEALARIARSIQRDVYDAIAADLAARRSAGRAARS